MSDEQTQDIQSSEDRLIEELAITIDAAIGIIVVRCPITEIFTVQDAIYSYAKSAEVDQEFRSWSSSSGWAKFSNDTAVFDPFKPSESKKTTNNVQAAFAELTNEQSDICPKEGIFVMLDAYPYLEEPIFVYGVRNQFQRALSNDQRLIIIVPETTAIPDVIAPLMHIIDYNLPTNEELIATFNDVIAQVSAEQRVTFSAADRALVAANGAGMTKTAFENAVSLAITEYSHFNEGAAGLTVDVIVSKVREYKTSMLRKTNMLDLVAPVPIEEVGGMENFKEWLYTRKASFMPEAIEFGITPARGCLAVGPSGTGKSLLAKACCSVFGLPGIVFDIGRVFNAYIGQSEHQMRQALKLIDAMAPCVLFMDEIDKGFAGMMGGSNDSGTTQRVFGTLLTWMQDRDQKTKPVFIVMTANRVEGLPAEMLRPGRIDEKWAVQPPNKAERREVFRIHAEKRGHEIEDDWYDALLELSEGLVGAEIEALIESALNRDLSLGNDGLTLDSIKKEREHMKPLVQSFAEQMKHMQEWAKKNARPASADDSGEGRKVARPGPGIPARRIKVSRRRHDG